MNCSCSAVSIIDSHEVERFQEFLCDKNPSAVWRDIPIDSQTLTHLTIGNSSINSLHFLPSLTSLTYLNLSFNQINDISPIAGLISLKVLDISHNKICDLNPIQQMSELAILRFHYNFIETLDPIRELGQLVEVWASRNHLEIFELFNILLWKNLQHIFIEGNPLDAKPKYLEFIHALSPNLFSINGLPIHSIFPVSKGHPSDFFRTVDGRLMLTQARSRLTDSQKEFLLKYHTVPLKTANCSQFFEQSSTNVVGFQHNINHQPSVQETSNTQYNEKIRYFKAKKHTLPRKFVSSNVNIQEFRGAVEENFNVESAQTVARFGEGSNAPVALLLESDGKGYARWGRNGPLACSFDGKRLFGAYRSGGIAVVMESEGHGSVITPTGECILNIHVVDSNFVADLQSDDGQLLSRYVKSHSSVKTKPQEWKFQELQISFFPDIWEMVIQLDNSVVQCKFSSLTGGVLLPSPAAKAISQRSKAKTSNLSKDVITPEVHEDIRIGLQSIMSDLDDMLEGMKKKRSY